MYCSIMYCPAEAALLYNVLLYNMPRPIMLNNTAQLYNLLPRL